MDIKSQTIIHKPVNEVWEYFTDPQNLKKWMGGLESVQPIKGEPGEEGSVSKHIVKERGQTIEMEVTIIDKNPPEKLSLELNHKDFKVKVVNLLEPVNDNSTTFITAADVKIKSFAYKLMVPVIKNELQKKQDEDLKRLKGLIEAEK